MQARSISNDARAWIDQKPDARVLHLFNKVCNLVSRHGQVLSLVSSEDLMGPFSMYVECPEAMGFRKVLRNDAPVSCQPDWLRIGSLTIHLEEAVCWDAALHWEEIRGNLKKISAVLPLIEEAVHWRSEQVESSHLSRAGLSAEIYESAYREIIDNDGAALAEGILGEDWERCRRSLRKLLGLGQGLTPAGDDYISGILLAAHMVLNAAVNQQLQILIRKEVPHRTTLLSTAWLLSAADGYASRLWHTWFDAVLREDWKKSREHLKVIASMGHTSGVEVLRGFSEMAGRCLTDFKPE